MADPLLHVSMTAQCPHPSGTVSVVTTNTRVKVAGQYAATVADTFSIAGCQFNPSGTTPSPCLTIQWIAGATRVKITGKSAVLTTSDGMCEAAGAVPQGPPKIIQTQQRVKGT